MTGVYSRGIVRWIILLTQLYKIMNKQIFVAIVLLLIVSFGVTTYASLTFTTDVISGTSAPTIDLGARNALNLQTINNGAITTGTGLTTLGGALNVATSITTPLIIGGAEVGSSITYKSTTGIGTPTGIAHQFTGGTDGATTAMTILNNGKIGIGTTTPEQKLNVRGSILIGESVLTGPQPPSGVSEYLYIAANEGSSIGHQGSAFVVTQRDTNMLHRVGTKEGLSSDLFVVEQYNSGSSAWDNFLSINNSGNVGIGTTTPGASSILDISSTTKGVVLPRMTQAQRKAIATPVAGMAIYQTDAVPGLRVYNGTNWMRFTETAD